VGRPRFASEFIVRLLPSGFHRDIKVCGVDLSCGQLIRRNNREPMTRSRISSRAIPVPSFGSISFSDYSAHQPSGRPL
jgi:hypothetical protein